MKVNERESRKPLTPKQTEFVRQYVLLKDATKAAVAAGYKPDNAASVACRLLQSPSLKREINKSLNRIGKQYGKQLAVAYEELFHCVTRRGSDFVDPETGRLLPIHELPERALAAIDGIEEEVKTDRHGTETVKRKLKLVNKSNVMDMAFKINGAYAKDEEGNPSTINNILIQQAYTAFSAMEPEYREWLRQRELAEVLGADSVGDSRFKIEVLSPEAPADAE
jgi:phage terminase small subunit